MTFFRSSCFHFFCFSSQLCWCWPLARTLCRVVRIPEGSTNLCLPRWLRLLLSLLSLLPTVSLPLASRHPPMFPAVSTVGGVALPQNMPSLDLAMKSPLVRLFSSTNLTRNFTMFTGQSLQQLKKEFADMRNTFNSRYVRLYSACDRKGFYDDVIEAAWCNSLGVHALIWVSLHATCIPSHPYLKASLASTAQISGLADVTVCSERFTRTQKPSLSHAWSNLALSLCLIKSCHPMNLPPKCCLLRKIYRV